MVYTNANIEWEKNFVGIIVKKIIFGVAKALYKRKELRNRISFIKTM